MTIIERTSRAMTRPIRGLPVKPDEDGSGNPLPKENDALARATPERKLTTATWCGDSESTRRLSSVVAAARDQGAAVIGVTGSRRGVGVSVSSRQIAEAFSSFGIKTLFVDLSQVDIVPPGLSKQSEEDATFLPFAVQIKPSLSVVEFEADRPPALTEKALRAALTHAVQVGFSVVVDLPSVLEKSGLPSPSIAATGLACDLVFLVCLSGGMSSKEVETSVEACRIIGLKMGGLILNDWQMPAHGFIAS